MATLADEPVPDSARRELNKHCVQVAIEPLGRSRWLRGAASLACGRSATEGLFASPTLRNTVRRWARERRFDAALVFCSSMVQYCDCPELDGVPTIIDLVDVDSQKWFDYAAKTRGLRRQLFQLEGRRLRRLECSLPTQAQAITLVSEAEASLYRSFCPNERTMAILMGVDLDYFRPQNSGSSPWQSLSKQDRCQLVFVGALDYRANVDAVAWFAAEVWPLARQRLPNLSLALVGRNPAPAVQRLANLPGIRVFADVPDVRPHVAAADLVIAPLRIARGVQNKVLEAMAMGKPVVTSPAALEGLAAEPGRHLLVADEPSQWAEVLAELLHDDELALSLGMSARRFVERSHAWQSTLEPLARLISHASEAPTHPEHTSPAAINISLAAAN